MIEVEIMMAYCLWERNILYKIMFKENMSYFLRYYVFNDIVMNSWEKIIMQIVYV